MVDGTGWVSRSEAATSLGVSRITIRWLVFWDQLTESFQNGPHGLIGGVTSESIDSYRDWQRTSSRRYRFTIRIIQVLFAPVKFVVENFGGAFTVPWN